MKNIQNSLTKYWKVPAPDQKQKVNCFFFFNEILEINSTHVRYTI